MDLSTSEREKHLGLYSAYCRQMERLSAHKAEALQLIAEVRRVCPSSAAGGVPPCACAAPQKYATCLPCSAHGCRARWIPQPWRQLG